MSKLSLVIFDMDGVLVDACEWHRVALDQALMHYCNYSIPIEDHIKEFNGLPTKVKLKKLNERGLVNADLFEQIETLKQQNTIKLIENNLSLDQDKIDLITSLKNNNIKVACYTNSIRLTATIMLNKIGILHKLDLLLTNEDVTKPKPDPEGYLLVTTKLNIPKEDSIIIEDSDKGIRAAQSSGIKYIKVKDATEVNLNLLKELI